MSSSTPSPGGAYDPTTAVPVSSVDSSAYQTTVPDMTDATLDANAAYLAMSQAGQENAISLIDGTEWTSVDTTSTDWGIL